MEKKIERTYYTKQANIILAFCAECLLGVFYSHKNNITKYELNMSFIKNTDDNISIYPISKNNNVQYVFIAIKITYLIYQ